MKKRRPRIRPLSANELADLRINLVELVEHRARKVTVSVEILRRIVATIPAK